MASRKIVSPEFVELEEKCKRCLLSNWLGKSTKPAPRLYPHQWSWDSAFISIGKAYYDQNQAQEELITLFRAQWKNGLVPHIVFNPQTASTYFPGPGWWNSKEITELSPRDVNTSGIVQPAVHAIAALKIWEERYDEASARLFLKDIFGPLKLWHKYLYEERQWKNGLVWIRHPWESGMDNSPLWDEAMANMDLKPEMVPPHTRSDITIVNAHDRPTQWTYDRFVYLVHIGKLVGYHESEIVKIKKDNFLVVDVLFNAILARANLALAEIAKILGEDPNPMLKWHSSTSKGLQTELWDRELKCFRNFDMIKGGLTAAHLSLNLGAFSPLYAGVPDESQLDQMLSVLNSEHFATLEEIRGGKVWPLVTLDRKDPGYKSHNYWRGPVWVNTNWLIYKGLLNYPKHSLASEYAKALKKATIDLVVKTGLWEYFDALDSSGHGTDDFSWTASLIIDLLHE